MDDRNKVSQYYNDFLTLVDQLKKVTQVYRGQKCLTKKKTVIKI